MSETAEVINLLKAIPGARFIDIPPSNVQEAAQQINGAITPTTKGIVIIGGYDVVPSAQLNVVSNELRQRIEDEADMDELDTESDDFIIWSDDIYGDVDKDFLPELPVSRIPEGKTASLVLNALRSSSFAVQDKFGIRNINRPFAINVFDGIPANGRKRLEVSETCTPRLVPKDEVSGAVYFMLHGYAEDATRFAGEKDIDSFEAFDIYNVPKSAPGTVVFSGCCYGALIALPKADRKEPDITLRSRTPEQSIALAFLLGGANAFVGCTAAHYSPVRPEDNFMGKPMHTSFWQQIEQGMPPALALFNAKKEYAAEIPHGLTRAILQAMEIKTLHQFTCLGLGW